MTLVTGFHTGHVSFSRHPVHNTHVPKAPKRKPVDHLALGQVLHFLSHKAPNDAERMVKSEELLKVTRSRRSSGLGLHLPAAAVYQSARDLTVIRLVANKHGHLLDPGPQSDQVSLFP